MSVISVLIWKERIWAGSIVGILLIIAGVVVLTIFGSGHSHAAPDDKTKPLNEQSL